MTDCSLLCCFNFKTVNELFPVSTKKFAVFYFAKPHKRDLGAMNQIKSPIKITDQSEASFNNSAILKTKTNDRFASRLEIGL